MRRARILGAREKGPCGWGERPSSATGVCPGFRHYSEGIDDCSGADVKADADASMEYSDSELEKLSKTVGKLPAPGVRIDRLESARKAR